MTPNLNENQNEQHDAAKDLENEKKEESLVEVKSQVASGCDS